MKHVDFWFDPVSPFAYLAFERLPRALEGLSCEVSYRPLLFAGLLKHWGQKGPAEIEPKRAWTFRLVHWQAHSMGLPMRTPLQHPFNPLALSRLLLACAPAGSGPNRRACELVLRHVWCSGADANDPDRFARLADQLSPPIDPNDASVKRALKDATDLGIAEGVFGVPTMVFEGRHFWGVDGIDMLVACMRGDPWFDGPAWDREGTPREGVVRKIAPG